MDGIFQHYAITGRNSANNNIIAAFILITAIMHKQSYQGNFKTFSTYVEIFNMVLIDMFQHISIFNTILNVMKFITNHST